MVEQGVDLNLRAHSPLSDLTGFPESLSRHLSPIPPLRQMLYSSEFDIECSQAVTFNESTSQEIRPATCSSCCSPQRYQDLDLLSPYIAPLPPLSPHDSSSPASSTKMYPPHWNSNLGSSGQQDSPGNTTFNRDDYDHDREASVPTSGFLSHYMLSANTEPQQQNQMSNPFTNNLHGSAMAMDYHDGKPLAYNTMEAHANHFNPAPRLNPLPSEFLGNSANDMILGSYPVNIHQPRVIGNHNVDSKPAVASQRRSKTLPSPLHGQELSNGSQSRKVSASTSENRPPESTEAAAEHKDCYGREDPPRLLPNTNAEHVKIHEFRWEHRGAKGDDMWNRIQQAYEEWSGKCFGKETLQMRFTRARRFIDWKERDLEILREAFEEVERKRYASILETFLKKGGSQNMRLCPNDIELKLVSTGMEEDVYMETNKDILLRRRQKSIRRQKQQPKGKKGLRQMVETSPLQSLNEPMEVDSPEMDDIVKQIEEARARGRENRSAGTIIAAEPTYMTTGPEPHGAYEPSIPDPESVPRTQGRPARTKRKPPKKGLPAKKK